MSNSTESGGENLGLNRHVLVFVGPTYYPAGGIEDLKGQFESIELAKSWLANFSHEFLEDSHAGWYQIVNLDNLNILEADNFSLENPVIWTSK